MGDIVALVEKAAQSIDAEKAQKIADRMRKGRFDLEDLADQLAQVEKIGGLGGIMGMLPGIAKMKDQINSANLDDRMIKRQRAIILSMTREERRNPDVLKASRKKRIASGSGTRVEDVNRLLKQHRQMADMMKAMGGMKRGAMGKMAQMFGMGGGGMGGGMPQPTPEQIEALQKQMGNMPGMPGGMPPMPGGLPAAPPLGAFGLPKMPAGMPGLPGLGGGKLPGLGGFNPFGRRNKHHTKNHQQRKHTNVP
jgi:signal recognition particle subunit SRP54